jgi:hypothetical protein
MPRFVWRVHRRLARLGTELLPGEAPLRIDALIGPLRYDVLVRQEFLTIVRDQRDRIAEDFVGFVADAHELDYYAWFRHVASRHVGLRPTSPSASLDRAFRRRVVRTIRLSDAFWDIGFDHASPITVRLGGGAVASGKVLGPRAYPLDGCHRLALLRMSGATELTPEQYRVAVTVEPVADNTHILLRHLDIERADYYRFVAAGYGIDACSRDGLLRAAHGRGPDTATEVEGLLRVDEPLLGRGRTWRTA